MRSAQNGPIRQNAIGLRHLPLGSDFGAARHPGPRIAEAAELDRAMCRLEPKLPLRKLQYHMRNGTTVSKRADTARSKLLVQRMGLGGHQQASITQRLGQQRVQRAQLSIDRP